MMKRTISGKHNKAYLIDVYYWARHLEATEMEINRNGSVTLMGDGGYICINYRPTKRDFIRARIAEQEERRFRQ